ncbi:MAG TPA: C45 family peptidase [Steroidobacteraceae bacterium]|nr:C45 family peptidase [Steroidobacteraceae bacterium]
MNAARLEETAAFPFIEVSGNPRNAGLQYGRKAAARVHRSIEMYRAYFARKGIDWARARSAAASFAASIEQAYPRLFEEMRALAEGADVPLDDILAINARTELLHGSFGKARAGADDIDGCTGVVALPSATREGHLIHAHNWDWHDECADSAIVLKIVPDTGPSMLVFTEAGVMAHVGMNNAGLGVSSNHLQSDLDGKRTGVPNPILRHQVLTQSSLCPAIETVLEAPRSFSTNFIISHREGEAIDLETTPEDAFWLAPEDDVLVHANHFVAPSARAAVRDLGLFTNADSLYRDSRVRRYLVRDRGRVTLSTIQAALQDRFGSPRAVCRSPIPGKSSSTVATIIMDTTERIMWVAPRPYGPHRFTEYRLP